MQRAQQEWVKSKVGFVDFEIATMNYLKEKYKSIADIYAPPADLRTTVNRSCFQMIWNCKLNQKCFDNENSNTKTINNDYELSKTNCKTCVYSTEPCCRLLVPSYFETKLKKTQKRFTLIRLLIIFEWPDQMNRILKTSRMFMHANSLIFDQQQHTLMRYEPFGPQLYDISFMTQTRAKAIKTQVQKSNAENDALTDKIRFYSQFHVGLNRALQEYAGKYNYRYIAPEVNSPFLGLQYYQEKERYFQQEYQNQVQGTKREKIGFCSAWTIFFLELLLQYPNESSTELIERTLQDHKGNLTQLIENYCFSILQN